MPPPAISNHTGAGGFTLMEILVAVAILAMAYLAILQNFSLSFRNLEKLEVVWRRDFAAVLERERDFRTIPLKAEVEPLVGEILVSGSRYQVVLVSSATAPGQSTLLLEKRP